MQPLLADSWGLYLAFLLFLAGAYTFVTPLLTMLVLKIQAVPEVQIVDDSNPLPSDVEQKFNRVDRQLEKLGFQEKDTCLVPNAVTNVTTILRLYLNYAQQDAAMTVAMFSNANGTWTERTHYVEFCSRTQNGMEVNTGNNRDVSAFKVPANTFTTHAPSVTDLAQLYKAHQGFVQQQFKGAAKVLKIQTEFGGDTASYLSAGIIDELESARKDGYLKFSSDRKYYLATVKGAYLMTWNEIPPFRQFLRARYRAAARQRLKSV